MKFGLLLKEPKAGIIVDCILEKKYLKLMAEIKIEKKNNNFWPWILGLLVVIALIWFISTSDRDEMERNTSPQTTEEADTTGRY